MKRLKRVLLGLLAIVVLSILGFVVWTENPLKAAPEALSALESDSQVTVSVEDGFISFQPVDGVPDTAFVFYPGGRVDYRAYAAPLHQIAAQGHQVILLHVKLNLAFFDANAAEKIFELYPNIKNWAVGGHSLGGVTAGSFATSHDVKGLILWASYPSDDSLKNKNLSAISIYGTLDITDMDVYDEKQALLPLSTEYVVIQGGNHAQFGDYGFQPGDNEATISRVEQQRQVVDATVNFLEMLGE